MRLGAVSELVKFLPHLQEGQWKEEISSFAADFCLLMIARTAHLGNGQDESVGRG